MNLLPSTPPSPPSLDDDAPAPRWRVVCRTGTGAFGSVDLTHADGALPVAGATFADADTLRLSSACSADPSAAVFEVSYLHADCRIRWHAQAFNALPLPLMTHFVTAQDEDDSDDAIPLGLCLDPASGELGAVQGGGPSFGFCRTPSAVREGDYLLLGAFNISARYVPPARDDDTPRTAALAEIDRLMGLHVTAEDRRLLERVTGAPFAELLAVLREGDGPAARRFLSADRFVHDPAANCKGLHLLRSLLARRITDARRRALGLDAHPDFAAFARDGYVIKDFSTMDEAAVQSLLKMVSGYADADLPELTWKLRSTVGNPDDNNLDLHVDTFAPSWKVWLYAQDIRAEHGPLTYVTGSHRPSEDKLKFLFRASCDPPLDGAAGYGSFRMGMYGSNRTRSEEEASVLSRRKTVVLDSSGCSDGNCTAETKLAPFVADASGVWRCHGCVDDETSYGMPARRGLVGAALSLVVADISGLHARGLSARGVVRRTFVLDGHQNDGGLQRVNPFTYFNPEQTAAGTA